ncbi:MAG: hypothetical protein LH603_04140 [Pseudonocardia sp.]|nr:hypothetical protein [Pseudonocardia sp.]
MRDDNRRGFQIPDNPFGRARTRTNGANGVHPCGLRTRTAEGGDLTDPVDLVAVQADDELIDALAAGMAVSAPGLGGDYDVDDQVAAVLAVWKMQVDAEPIPELVDIDTAIAAVMAGRPPSRRVRHLAPVAAAAVFLVLVIGGVSVGSYSAEPGDALWGVSQVLNSERAESVEAAVRVETRIARAKQAIAEGQPQVAAQELQMAAAELAAVRPEEGLTALAEVQDFLVAKVVETPPGVPTDPGAPLVGDSRRKVPAGAAITVTPLVPPGVVPSSAPVSPRDVTRPVPPDPTLDQRPFAPGPSVSPTVPPDPGTGPTAPPVPSSIPTSVSVPASPPTPTAPGPLVGGATGATLGGTAGSSTASETDSGDGT